MASAAVLTQLGRARLKKFEKAIARKSVATMSDLVNAGKEYARWTAPKNSGAVYKTIKGQVRQTTNGAEGDIYIDENLVKNIPRGEAPNGKKIGLGKYGGNFNLVRWMHETGGRFKTDNPYGKAGKQHIPYHEATFMYRTRDYLNSIKKRVAKGNFDRLNLK